MKKILIHIRAWVKFLLLMVIASFLILGTVAFFYKPVYAVTLNGEEIGYTENKTEFQAMINGYTDKGDENSDNIAFAQIENFPEYKLCLLKRDVVTNEDEIFAKIKDSSTTYYRYFAILENGEEKLYISDLNSAEQIVNKLKEKSSTNIDKVSIIEKYETELKDFTAIDTAVAKLYVEPVKEPETVTVATTKSKSKTTKVKSTGTVNTSLNTSNSKVSIGISLAKPISGTITSRFGAKSNIRRSSHTGLDIAASKGTPIGAAASGTVSFAGYKGSYGNLVVITHSNGVQTYYGHCSAIYVSAGQNVSQGQKIAAVGSTGNSTGPHLHLEVRVNGVAYNPQNYVY